MPGLLGKMFVAGDVLLDLSFPAAEAQLPNLARGGSLTRVSEGAYGDGLTGLVWVGPVGAVSGVSKLVEVHFRDVVTRGESAVLALRWQATGPGGRLFPALADVLGRSQEPPGTVKGTGMTGVAARRAAAELS